MTQLCKKIFIPVSRRSWNILPNSTRWRRRMGRNCTSMQIIYLFSSIPTSQTVGTNSSRHIYRTDPRGSYCEIVDEYGIEVAVPSICKSGDVTYVVISRETERFVNEIHTHEARIRSSKELLEHSQESKESVPHKQREVTTSPRETWVAPNTGETRVGSVKLVPNKASIFTRKTIPRNEKKRITFHANPKRGSDLAISV